LAATEAQPAPLVGANYDVCSLRAAGPKINRFPLGAKNSKLGRPTLAAASCADFARPESELPT